MMCNDLSVLILCYMWEEITVPICIFVDKYDDCLKVMFCCYSCLMNGLKYNILWLEGVYTIAFLFVCKGNQIFYPLRKKKKSALMRLST